MEFPNASSIGAHKAKLHITHKKNKTNVEPFAGPAAMLSCYLLMIQLTALSY